MSKPQPAGVGLYFKTDPQKRYYVEMVLENTSASATGVVKTKDILELVQNESVVGKSLTQLRQMILGPPGTYVNLSFLREMENDSFRFDVDLLRGDPNAQPEHVAPSIEVLLQPSSMLYGVPPLCYTNASSYPFSPSSSPYTRRGLTDHILHRKDSCEASPRSLSTTVSRINSTIIDTLACSTCPFTSTSLLSRRLGSVANS